MASGEFTANLACRLDTASVDVVFCMDSSKSMDPYIDDLHDQMSYFINQLESHGYDYRLGGVPFDDSTNVWDFNPSLPGKQMTASDTEFLARLAATGGSIISSDFNEVSLDAICDAIRLYDWREDALRVIIMFTNEGYHYQGDSTTWSDETVEGTRSLVFSTGTIVFVAASSRPAPQRPIPPDHLANFQNLAWDSGGQWYPLSTTWDVIFDDVVDLISTFMTVSADITNVTGGACTVTAEIIPLESSCISLLSTNPYVSPAPVASGDSFHVFWKVILDSTCTGTDQCFDIRISGAGYVDSVYGCIVDDSCFGHTAITAEISPPSITAGCRDIHPNPITLTAHVINDGTRPATAVSALFSPIDAGIAYVGGAPNPCSIDEILYDGGVADINWLVSVAPSAYGSTRCFEIYVTHAEGSVVREAYCITIPPLRSSPILTITASDSLICPSASTSLNAAVVPSGSWLYSWSPATGLSNPNIANPVATPSEATTYSLTVTDGVDCMASSSIFIDVAPLMRAYAGSDTTIFSGEPVTIGGFPAGVGGYGALSYSWSPATWLSNPNISNPIATPLDSIVYTLTVTDAAGCHEFDSVRISVIPAMLGLIFIKTETEIINLRVIDTLAAISAGNGVVMVTLPGGLVGAADLVDTTDVHASGVHINTVRGIRAWRRSWE